MPPRSAVLPRRGNGSRPPPDPFQKTKVAASAARLSVLELEKALAEIRLHIRKADDSGGTVPSLWAALDTTVLKTLYARALRQSCAALEPDVTDAHRAVYTSLRSELTNELFGLADETKEKTQTHMPPADVRQLVSFALRSQALRCIAAAMAETATHLSARRQRPSSRTVKVTKDLLEEAMQLPDATRMLMSSHEGEPGTLQADLLSPLVLELEASNLFEHWSRLLLQLAACEGGGVEAATQELCRMVDTVKSLDLWLRLFPKSTKSFASMVRRPAFFYLLSSHLVGLCTFLDGGTTYGMPPAVDEEEDEHGSNQGGSASAEGADAAASSSLAGPRRPGHVTPVYSLDRLRLRRRKPGVASTKLATLFLPWWIDAITWERQQAEAVPRASEAGVSQAAASTTAEKGSAASQDASSEAAVPAAGAGALSGAAAQPGDSTDGSPAVPLASQAAAASGSGASKGACVHPAAAGASVQLASCTEMQEARSAAAEPSANIRAKDGPADIAGPPRPPPLQSAAAEPGSPPLRTGATLDICMRLAAAAFNPMPAPGPASRQAGAAKQIVRLRSDNALELGITALRCGRTALGERVMEAQSVPPRMEERLRRWCAMLVEAMTAMAAMTRVAVSGSAELGELVALREEILALRAPGGPQGLPASPSACIAAAISANVVPALNGLLCDVERLGATDWVLLLAEPLYGLSAREMFAPQRPSVAWEQLLAFGNPLSSSRLVDTLARLMRSCADPKTSSSHQSWALCMMLKATQPTRQLLGQYVQQAILRDNAAQTEVERQRHKLPWSEREPSDGAGSRSSHTTDAMDRGAHPVQSAGSAAVAPASTYDASAAAPAGSDTPVAEVLADLHGVNEDGSGSSDSPGPPAVDAVAAAVGGAQAQAPPSTHAGPGPNTAPADASGMPAAADPDWYAPGLPRLALLASYMAVELIPVVWRTLVHGFLPHYAAALRPTDRVPFIAMFTAELLGWCGSLLQLRSLSGGDVWPSATDPGAAAVRSPSSDTTCLQGDTGAPAYAPCASAAAAAGRPEPACRVSVGATSSQSAGAPSGLSPDAPCSSGAPVLHRLWTPSFGSHSARADWRRVLMDDLCLGEVMGMALGLITGGAAAGVAGLLTPLRDDVGSELMRNATFDLGPDGRCQLRHSTAVVLTLLQRLHPDMLAEVLTSDRAERAAALAAEEPTQGRDAAPAAATAAQAAASSDMAPSSSSSAAGLRPSGLILRGLKALVAREDYLARILRICDLGDPAQAEAAAGEAGERSRQRHMVLPPPGMLRDLLAPDLPATLQSTGTVTPGGSNCKQAP